MYPPPPPPFRPASHAGSTNSSGYSHSCGSQGSSNTLPLVNQPTHITDVSIAGDVHESPASSSIAAEGSTETGPDGLGWVFTPPILVKDGMFKGRWLRFALAVAQEPVLGRRKTEKDRRPLGPAPIVRFRAVECRRRRSGTMDWNEEEVDPSSIEPSHLICAAELSSPTTSPPRLGPSSSTTKPAPESSADAMTAQYSLGTTQEEDVGDVPMIEGDERLEFMVPSGIVKVSDSSDSSSRYDPIRGAVVGPSHPPPVSSTPEAEPSTSAEIDPDMSASTTTRAGDSSMGPPTSSKSTSIEGATTATTARKGVRNLYGTLHVAGVKVPAPEGGMGTWFLFTDLSVRHEGTYSLRFRCFDLTAIGPSVELPSPCLVECQSQPFRVYSPRQVPPLPKPTELAEHFARQGFKLNTRKNERTMSSPPPLAASLTTAPASGTVGGPTSTRTGPLNSHSQSAQLTTTLSLTAAEDGGGKRPRIAPLQDDSVGAGSSTSGGGSTDSGLRTASGSSAADEV